MFSICFLKQPYRVRYQIKAKNKNITITFFVLLLFVSEDFTTKTKTFDTHIYQFLLLRSVKYRILASTNLDFRLDNA